MSAHADPLAALKSLDRWAASGSPPVTPTVKSSQARQSTLLKSLRQQRRTDSSSPASTHSSSDDSRWSTLMRLQQRLAKTTPKSSTGKKGKTKRRRPGSGGAARRSRSRSRSRSRTRSRSRSTSRSRQHTSSSARKVKPRRRSVETSSTVTSRMREASAVPIVRVRELERELAELHATKERQAQLERESLRDFSRLSAQVRSLKETISSLTNVVIGEFQELWQGVDGNVVALEHAAVTADRVDKLVEELRAREGQRDAELRGQLEHLGEQMESSLGHFKVISDHLVQVDARFGRLERKFEMLEENTRAHELAQAEEIGSLRESFETVEARLAREMQSIVNVAEASGAIKAQLSATATQSQRAEELAHGVRQEVEELARRVREGEERVADGFEQMEGGLQDAEAQREQLRVAILRGVDRNVREQVAALQGDLGEMQGEVEENARKSVAVIRSLQKVQQRQIHGSQQRRRQVDLAFASLCAALHVTNPLELVPN